MNAKKKVPTVFINGVLLGVGEAIRKKENSPWTMGYTDELPGLRGGRNLRRRCNPARDKRMLKSAIIYPNGRLRGEDLLAGVQGGGWARGRASMIVAKESYEKLPNPTIDTQSFKKTDVFFSGAGHVLLDFTSAKNLPQRRLTQKVGEFRVGSPLPY